MSIAYAAHDLRRNVRMVENTFFVVVLPAVLYVMFTALGDFSDRPAGHGNAGGYNMISMAVYGAVTATTSIAGSAAVEQARGWGRQIGLTPAPRHGYVLAKVAVALAMAVLPVLAVYAVGALTGAELGGWRWPATAAIVVAGSSVFALYGLAAGLLFRSESAVSAASGLLVVLSFFGNLFVPLTGVMLDIARFTPLYGLAGLARYPLVEGDVVATSGPPVESDPLWALLLNTGLWAVVFAAVVLLAVRRTTVRR
ncbi:hypothetical protein GCM10009696_08400 [Kocuria himachalensis]